MYDRLVEAGADHGLTHAGMATLESTRTEAGRLDYGETLGGAMGFGYVDHADGVTAAFVAGGDFEIVVAGERFPARASLRSMYDQGYERVGM